ncbi:head GIN domain-containing protein [Amphiplicatus metriothermophilus]|uniref:Putative auto-transporter adhesin, head GIN domain n=1 Tax=Amphiplicatus metriothermophilus TaxID=1519374 RepID=A0A239PTH3_9PROT|nr:head GIN domain-containing protein [Amphiplicatus metriothermophilus]MBB5519420.1 hypothetical protein [Amphiplicatus metriothermophilus]SNT73585.1 Putative auto-transporter adhesin, head GIN domain [Amphiplicatus metriothermophilus]
MHARIIAAMGAGLVLAAGSALAETRDYDLSGFDAVSVSSGQNAVITVGGNYSVRAEGTEKALERLDILVKGDELVIRRKPRVGIVWGRSETATVYVTTPTLARLDVSSGADATATGVDSDNFVVDASSGADVEVSGRCGALVADVSSGASIRADGLECRRVTADASSGGSMRVFASESVTADASSGGDIDVYGGPDNVNIDESSGGDVSIRN